MIRPQPWYRTTHWGAWGALFFMWTMDKLNNDWPKSPQAWTILIVQIGLFAVTAYNTVTGAKKTALP